MAFSGGALLENPTVRTLADVFASAGEPLYLVGGPVRDLFVSERYDDLDFATPALPDRIEELVSPLGSIWDAGRLFGTIGVSLNGEKVEITTFRADSYDGISRRPEVVFGEHIEDDLRRRDFTMNAMAVDVVTGDLIDPYGGARDIDIGLLRTPGEPFTTIADDPLRSLRAIRFASTRGMSIEHLTRTAIKRHTEALESISQERKTAELMKIAAHGAGALTGAAVLATALGVRRHLFGDLHVIDLVGTSPNLDTVATLAFAVYGTPMENLAAELTRMRFSVDDTRRIVAIHQAAEAILRGPDAIERRYLIRRNPNHVLNPAIAITHRHERRGWQSWMMSAELGTNVQWARGALPVDGSDFLACGLAGPAIGRVLRVVEMSYLHKPGLTKEDAMRIGLTAVDEHDI